MHKREHLLSKINILLLAIHQFRDTEQVSFLLDVIEKELKLMSDILNENEQHIK